jgi:hypothetical protein
MMWFRLVPLRPLLPELPGRLGVKRFLFSEVILVEILIHKALAVASVPHLFGMDKNSTTLLKIETTPLALADRFELILMLHIRSRV